MICGGFLGGAVAKNLPANARVAGSILGLGRSVLGLRRSTLEKEMTTHTPIFLPGKSHVQRSLADCSPRGRKELDTARLVTKYQPQHDLYAAFLLGDRQRYRGKQITQHTR